MSFHYRTLFRALPLILAPLAGAVAWWLAMAATWFEPLNVATGPRGPFDEREVRDNLLIPSGLACSDFDLSFNVELAADTELDVILRIVQPQKVHRGVPPPLDGILSSGAEEFPQGHDRFVVLRLSTNGEGPPLLTRDQALFFDDPLDRSGGGALQAPGAPYTVLVEGRGRAVRAHVLGRWTPWFPTDDGWGRIFLCARGGPAVVRFFKEFPRTPAGDGGCYLAAGGVLLATLLSRLLGAERRRLLLATALLWAGAWFGTRWFAGHLEPLAIPSSPGQVLLALLGLGPAFAVAARRLGSMALVLAILLPLATLEGVVHLEWPLLVSARDPRLDLFFEPSGTLSAVGALARRVRPVHGVLQTRDQPEHTIVFLGGAAVFQNGAREDSLFRNTVGALRAKVAGGITGVTLPTFPGSALQHVRVFERFYREYRPQVLVFAFHPFEMEPGPGNLRARFDAAAALTSWPPGPSFPGLLHLFPGTVDQVPVAIRADLESAFEELLALAVPQQIPVVVWVDPELPDHLRSLSRDLARDHELLLVEGRADDAMSARGRQFAAALAPLLR